MRIAYIISAYRLPDQVVRLVRRLDDGEALFFVHVDARHPDVYQEVATALRDHPRLQLLEPSPCRWGDFGHVRASLKAIAALTGSGSDFDDAVLLTGQDYPIKSLQWIHEFLGRDREAIYLDHAPLPRRGWAPRGGLNRIEYPYVYPFGRAIRVPIKRRLPLGHRPFGGASYWVFPRYCAEFVADFTANHPDYVRYFERVRVPDELFFQTIILNSPLRDHIVNAHLHHTVWADAPHPETLTTEDLPACLESTKPFARKFDTSVDPSVLDLIDHHVFGESVC